MWVRRDFLGWGCTLLGLTACSQQTPDEDLRYHAHPVSGNRSDLLRLVPHPLYNPQTLAQVFQPLVDHLNGLLSGPKLVLETSRDYTAFENKIRAREAEIIFPNPWQTLLAQRYGFRVVAQWGDPEDFKGLFITRRDSQIHRPTDLRGKTVCYPSPTALAAAILPQQFLHDHGIDVLRDIHNTYVGSQESSIMNVLMGQVAVGATWPPPWRLFQRTRPNDARQLKVLWETPSLINNSVMVRDDLDPDLGAALARMLLDLTASNAGRAVLKSMETTRFHPAADADYEVVRQTVERFERLVRPVEGT